MPITDADLQRFLPLQRHAFMEGFEMEQARLDALMAALVEDNPHGQDTFELRNLGSVGDWYEWFGEEAEEALNQFSGSQTVKEWHNKFTVDKRDLAFDAGPILENRARAIGERARSKEIRELIATHLETDSTAAGATGRVISGLKFFSPVGDGGHWGQSANVNSLTASASDTGRMTAAEWQTVHRQTINQIKGFVDDKNIERYLMVSEILYIANDGHLDGFNGAFGAQLVGGGNTNIWLGGGEGFGNVKIMTFPTITATRVYSFNISPGVPKPFFRLRPIDEGDAMELTTGFSADDRKVITRGHMMWAHGFNNPLAGVLTTLS
jgi:hypothetical protein